MPDPALSAVVLGLVEGLTEFLPVSSTGHLILAGHLLGFTDDKAKAFEIIIQLGAILAVAVMYWPRFVALLDWRSGGRGRRPRFAGPRGLTLLFLTSLPASLLGLVAHRFIKEQLFGPTTVALALGVGALAILAVEASRKRSLFSSLDDLTPAAALGVGLFQCLSLWPGFSRSASTIMGGMLLGAERRVAAEYSFIAAVPIMVAATAFELRKDIHLFSQDDLLVLGLGFAVSFVSAWLAVKGFIHLLQRTTLRPFAWYRLALAPAILLFWPR